MAKTSIFNLQPQRGEPMPATELATILITSIQCAFLEGYNAGHRDAGGDPAKRDARQMASAWTNSEAYDRDGGA